LLLQHFYAFGYGGVGQMNFIGSLRESAKAINHLEMLDMP
jgi:hypothetical protein